MQATTPRKPPNKSRRPSELREKRERLGLTQQGLAEKFGVSVLTISRWERGAARPIPAFQKMIDSLGDVFPGETK